MKIFRTKRRTPAQSLKASLASAVVIIALETAMKHWIGANNVVATLLAGGGNAPFLHIAIALAFVLLRIFVFLILPGVIARELFLALMNRRASGPA
jgi:hypothetical protein